MFEEGQMYTIRYQSQSGNYRWYEYIVTMKYIGEDQFGNLLFSLRPLAGTQSMRPEKITDVMKVDDTVPPKFPRRIGEVKKDSVSS